MRVKLRRLAASISMALVLGTTAAPASAYLFWVIPDFSGPPVRGDEPGVAEPLPSAKPDEVRANLVWTIRAALNIAALQCQFARPLQSAPVYNTILSQHSTELTNTYQTLGNYFKRTGGREWRRQFDAHTTRMYNGLSTLHGQRGFCETSAKVGRVALGTRQGELYKVAELYAREIRNSLTPAPDMLFTFHPRQVTVQTPSLDAKCWNRKGELKKKCRVS